MSGRRSEAFREQKFARFMPVLRVVNRGCSGVIAKENDTRLYLIGPIAHIGPVCVSTLLTQRLLSRCRRPVGGSRPRAVAHMPQTYRARRRASPAHRDIRKAHR